MPHIVEEFDGTRMLEFGPLYINRRGRTVRNDIVWAWLTFVERLDDNLPERELFAVAQGFWAGFRAGEINAGRADADNPEAEKSAPSAP